MPELVVPTRAMLEENRKLRASCPWYSYFSTPELRRGYAKHVAFMAAGKDYRQRLFLSGNRSGKTATASFEMVCHLTGAYPSWWEGKRFEGPIEAWAGGDTGQTVRDIIQVALLGPVATMETRKWDGMIPAPAVYDVTRRPGLPGAASAIYVHHKGGGVSVLGLLSYDQGRETWQGTAKQVCLAEGSLVQMWDGTLRPIEKVGFGDFVLSLDTDGNVVPRCVLGCHDQGTRACVRVRPKHGTSVVCTPDHELYWGYSRKSRRPASDTRAIAQPRPGTFWPDKTVDREAAWYVWTALVIAEGTISQRKVTNGDVATMQRAIALLPKEARVRRVTFKGSHVPDWYLYWDDFWKEANPALSHEKSIPEWVFRSSPGAVVTFLRWLYMGDGWASGNGIGYATTSALLAEQIVVLLNRLGIRATLRTRASAKEGWREQFWVTVMRSSEVLIFARLIGIEGKGEALARVVAEAERRVDSKKHRSRHLVRTGENLWRRRDEKTRLKASKVSSCEPCGEHRVFDLSVEGEHRFLTGTSLVSNCWMDEEPPDDVYGEALMRLMTTGGIMMATMTPLKGLTPFVGDWLRKSVLEVINPDTGLSELRHAHSAVFAEGGGAGEVQSDSAVPMQDLSRYTVMASWDDCPHLGEAVKAEMAKECPPHLLDARRSGVPSLGSGTIFPIPESEIRVKPFEIPDHWPRCWGADTDSGAGWTAAIWLAWDRESNTYYIYDCFKRRHAEPAVHIDAIKARGAWIPGVADAAGLAVTAQDSQQVIALWRKGGLDVQLPKKGVESGIQEMWELLSAGRLKVFSSLGAWFDEYRLYRRDDKGRVVKQADHLCDSSRYAIVSGRARMKTKPGAPKEPTGSIFADPKTAGSGWMGA